MKRKSGYSYKILSIIAIISFGLNLSAQKEINETYTYSANVNEGIDFIFNNYNCDLEVTTSEENTIKYELSIDMTFKNEEDGKTLDEYLQGLAIETGPNKAEFDAKFWKSAVENMSKKTMTLKNGEKLRYQKFEISGKLLIPASCNLKLSSKYSTLDIEDLVGNTSIDTYNDRVYCGNIPNGLVLKAKYSKMELGDLGDTEMDIYNTKIYLGHIGTLSLVSKYSTLEAKNTSDLDLNSYNDKFKFENTGAIKFMHKYSDLLANTTENVETNSYNGSLTLSKAGDMNITSKYNKFEIGDAGIISIADGYNDTYNYSSISNLEITKSKYCTYKVSKLQTGLNLKDGYDDNFEIYEVGADLSNFSVDGKYLKIEMAVPSSLDYTIKANAKYATLEIPWDELEIIKQIENSSEIELEAIKGSKSNDMSVININGYQVKLIMEEK